GDMFKLFAQPGDGNRTTLNYDVDAAVVKIGTAGGEWSTTARVKNSDVVSFLLPYHITGAKAALDLRAHLDFEHAGSEVLAHARLTAANAAPADGMVRISCEQSCASVTFRPIAARWYFGGSANGEAIQAYPSDAAGVPLGDRPAGDQASLVVWYE